MAEHVTASGEHDGMQVTIVAPPGTDPEAVRDMAGKLAANAHLMLPAGDPLAEHGCLWAAVIVFEGSRTWYPCRSHENGSHHFAARWPDPCPAPWCRLPGSHYMEGTMHDIPPGTVEIHDAAGVKEIRRG